MGDGVLIDPKGRVWAESSPELARRLACTEPGADVVGMAVREEGFIHIRGDQGRVRVTLRERHFNFTTFAGAMLVLGRMKPARILLSVITDKQPAFRIFFDLHDFCAEVEPLAAGKPVEIRIPRLSERRNRRALNLPTFACVRPIVDLWETTRGEFTDEVNKAVMGGALSERTILVRQPSPSKLITEHVGSGLKLMTPCEWLLTIGRDFSEHHPDRQYAAWVADAYAATLASRQICVESVRAIVRVSPTTVARTHYDRVMIPWRCHDASLLAMGLSIRRGLELVAVSSDKDLSRSRISTV